MRKSFRETLSEQLKNPEFKAEYEALELEYQVINALLDARKNKNISQTELSEMTGIAQGDISKFEKGIVRPSIKTLQRIAAGMGMSLKIEFVDRSLNQ